MSSSNSPHSSMSSLGSSSLGSPSMESFPQPPTPLLSPAGLADMPSEPLPPPPFPGAVPALPHVGMWKRIKVIPNSNPSQISNRSVKGFSVKGGHVN